MAYFPRYHHFGHGGFRHGGGSWRRRRPWLFRHHGGQPWGQGGDGDDDGDAEPPPPFPPSPPGLPFPLPLPSLETSETEAERYRRHRWRPEDQEMGLNDEPIEARGEDARGLGRRGRWVLRNGKLILYGV
jgi:hypothetical protein